MPKKKNKSTRQSPREFLPHLEKALIRAALAAGKVLMKYYTLPLEIQEKKEAGLVTQADFESEKAAMKVLKKACPEFGFLTEESHPISEGETPRGRWVIDPLDGTTNFVHRFPMFCVSLAAEWDGQIVAGVIYHPVLKDLYHARLGGGAFLNRKPLRVSTTQKTKDSLLSTGFTYRKDQWLHEEMEAFEKLSMIARAVRRPGSAALDLAYVARGVFDGFWERRLGPWDVAAGALLVREAGGQVTDFRGNAHRIEMKEILASNSQLHEDLRTVIAREL